jgi:hypothetical protein
VADVEYVPEFEAETGEALVLLADIMSFHHHVLHVKVQLPTNGRV